MSQMLAEIREQPDALARTLAEERKPIEDLRRRLAANPPRLVLLAARGTSDNAALFARYLLEITTGIPVSLAAPSIFTLYNASINFDGVLVVAISQSGESTDTNLVLERAREHGAVTIGVTNEPASTLAHLAEHTFLVRAGKEKSVAATKTYTGQLLMAYLLAYALGARMGADDLARIPELASIAVSLEDEIAARSERYRFMDHSVVIGRGLNYSNAFEFALKLMETCYVIAERFSAADLLHGPIAMIERSFPVFVFTPPGVTWPGLRYLLGRLEAMRAETMIITDASNSDAVKLHGRSIALPLKLGRKSYPVEELYTPIPYIIPAQIFAAKLAEEKGLDPDRPRALEKVTRTL